MNLSSSLNLVSESPLERDELRKLKTILNLLLQHSDSEYFRQPVDWKGLELLDYTRIVKKPMDLGTVSQKLHSQQYRFIEEVLDDIQLVWDNCKNYNQSNSWIYGTSDKMDKYFRKLIKNYFTSIPISQPTRNPEPVENNNRPTRVSSRRIDKQDSRMVDESSQESEGRKRLLERIKRLGPLAMGEVVDYIMTQCPQAFAMKDDKCSIFIEEIDDYQWRQIRHKLSEIEEGEDRPSKKVKM